MFSIIAVHNLNPRSKNDRDQPSGPQGDLSTRPRDAHLHLNSIYKSATVYGMDRDTFIVQPDQGLRRRYSPLYHSFTHRLAVMLVALCDFPIMYHKRGQV
jgi:hypothetical protein